MDTTWSETYLNAVRSRWVMVNYYSERIKQLETQLTSLGGSSLGERVQSSPTHDALERRVLDFIDEEERIMLKLCDLLGEANAQQDEAMERISTLKEGHRKDFLIEYYIKRKSIKTIADVFEHSDIGSTRNLKLKALEYFETMADLNGWKKIKEV